jgi:hypothetical protein
VILRVTPRTSPVPPFPGHGAPLLRPAASTFPTEYRLLCERVGVDSPITAGMAPCACLPVSCTATYQD